MRQADSLASLNYTEVCSHYQKCAYITSYYSIIFTLQQKFIKKMGEGFFFRKSNLIIRNIILLFWLRELFLTVAFIIDTLET